VPIISVEIIEASGVPRPSAESVSVILREPVLSVILPPSVATTLLVRLDKSVEKTLAPEHGI
jgi:hypothetical protein